MKMDLVGGLEEELLFTAFPPIALWDHAAWRSWERLQNVVISCPVDKHKNIVLQPHKHILSLSHIITHILALLCSLPTFWPLLAHTHMHVLFCARTCAHTCTRHTNKPFFIHSHPLPPTHLSLPTA